MPKDNEVDEKVMPVAWIVTNGGESCEPWLEYEQSEVDALPAVCVAEPLYSAATVAELRAEVERLALAWRSERDASQEYARDCLVANKMLVAAERRVGELEAEVERLRVVESAARIYFDGYCQDEASDEVDANGRGRWTGCPAYQISDAAALRDALTGADPT